MNGDPLAEFHKWQKKFGQTLAQMMAQNQFVGDIVRTLIQSLPDNASHIAKALQRAGFNPPTIALVTQS